MENKFEAREKIPEISKEALENIKSEVTNQPLEYRDFSIENISYTFIPCPSKNDEGETNGQPAEYNAQLNEWAIYIWEDLLEKIQKVLLFHEIIEIYFKEKYDMETTPAHNATLPYEEQFRKEILSEDEERAIQKLRNKYSI
ncbi:MAG: hypothetical protein UW81_C0040G0006 [Candidatus Giovannonibacteria bacterium GW2011_GWC2_44_9]|uniref:Uncharacterized protein n=3 Tax=Candidatus Giovannoniibacteriota TaxID=1752738 RepID=A0A0G1IS91_9BACT|nr:MAG: hypothetical protein UW49_C0018G0027 [Candidatus Giovannonibacteria bacterium GW2011_GWB1_44_23]KKT61798.1 MAG: hypothetical protein UW57_C0028G0006 [Candidatus Giovannonibacteria bacterium GW2011_GWA1_44_29]KKT82473.1 MAG: hypothetical protein UW81_C0040G0006 [Candidatus Giovannonibacteria bacterium GW2011_GWC2_44_9]KKT90583.1 MAG: hypothetical protein UW93_C0028G0006 [Parcubacteria group bacterium GW2011_GWC1_45_13]